MSNAGIGHNKGPIIAPTQEELFDDLVARYKSAQDRTNELEKAYATFPATLTLADEATAEKFQDLLGQIKKEQRQFGAFRKSEKKPWDDLAKTVTNFFTKLEERLDAKLEEGRARHQEFLDAKSAENQKKAEEAAARAKAEAEQKMREAEEAERRKREAEAAAELERAKERDAREAAARAKAEAAAAEERVRKAKEEEARIERERKEREENDRKLIGVKENLVSVWLKRTMALHTLFEADEASDRETAELKENVGQYSTLNQYLRDIASSPLATKEQVQRAKDTTSTLSKIALSMSVKITKREAAKREKQEADERARRERERKAEEERLRKVAEDRAKAEAEAETKRQEEQAARQAARASQDTARELEANARDLRSEARRVTEEADRATNRQDRIERKLERATDADFSRTRGDHGTVGSLSGRWTYFIADEDALRNSCGVLGEHFTEDALGGAVYRYMATRRAGFTGQRVILEELPGVEFKWERETRIA